MQSTLTFVFWVSFCFLLANTVTIDTINAKDNYGNMILAMVVMSLCWYLGKPIEEKTDD